MQTIYKYQLSPLLTQQLELPEGYKILTVDAQGNNLYLWAEVFTGNHVLNDTVTINIAGTGEDIAQIKGEYIGTAHMSSGLVWHIYLDARSQ